MVTASETFCYNNSQATLIGNDGGTPQRNIYEVDFGGSSTIISWSSTNNRWELVYENVDIEFSNTFASHPNPPALGTGTRISLVGCGTLTTFSGSGTQTGLYQNTGTNSNPTFTVVTGTNNPFNGVDVGFSSAPTFVDIDNDGDMDAFIGEYYGTINYYQNTGTNSNPTFTEQTGTNNPFNGVDVGFYSNLTFVDIDNDGDMDTFIGASDGTIKYYRNESVILPVELHSFSAKLSNQQTALHWQTASESNNQGFDIQWAMGNEQLANDRWETLDFVNGKGTTNELQTYQFTHDRPAAGMNYYRLKQMDFDGKFEYSNIEALAFENGQTAAVQFFPNPIKDGLLTVKLEGELETEVLLQVFDMTGKKVLQQSSFEKTNELNVSALSSGIFMMEIVANGQIVREKVVIE